MKLIRTRIEDLKVNDVICDNDGLELKIISLEPNGIFRIFVKVNYVERGFYPCNDTTWLKNRTSLANKIVY